MSMKRILITTIVCIFIGVFLFQAYSGAAAERTATPAVTIYLYDNDPYMVVNDQKVEIDPGRGTVPFSENNRMMLPIRAVIEHLGGTVYFDAASAKTILTLDDQTVELWTGKYEIAVNGVLKPIDVAPVSRSNRNFVPVRFVAESFGCDVEWQKEFARVKITYYGSTSEETVSNPEPLTTATPSFSPEPKADGANIMGVDISVEAGTTVYFKFFAYDLEDFGKFDFKVEYDASKLTAVSVIKGALKASDYISTMDISHAEQGYITVSSDDVTALRQDNGVLFAVAFHVKSNASGRTKVLLNGQMYTSNGEPIEPLNIEQGFITIRPNGSI